MGFLKQHEGWLARGTVLALLITGTIFLFKFLVDSQPSLIPAHFSSVIPPPSPPPNPSPRDHDDCRSCSKPLTPNPVLPNSFLPCDSYVKPGSSTHTLDIAKYFKVSVEDSELLHAAQDAASLPLPSGKPKIAFLFILRQHVPLEPLWERFFAGAESEEEYSIYTHGSWWTNDFPKESVFFNKSIPTKPVSRFDVSLVDVVRRLLAFALLDVGRANMWFVLVSEACMPVRSFPFVYEYFMKSETSFVEAYSPHPRFKRWESEPLFEIPRLRKGELWMSMHRRHAGMVVGDVTYYRKFKADCRDDCVLDEEYTQTLLHSLDPKGIANRSVTYADWSNPNHGGSPLMHTAEVINATLFTKIQNRTRNLDGQYMDSSDDFNHTVQTCVYNGRTASPCYLFARKFSGSLIGGVSAGALAGLLVVVIIVYFGWIQRRKGTAMGFYELTLHSFPDESRSYTFKELREMNKGFSATEIEAFQRTKGRCRRGVGVAVKRIVDEPESTRAKIIFSRK